MLVPKTRPRGVPHRLLEVIFDNFVVVGSLGRCGRVLMAFLQTLVRFGRAVEWLLGGLQRSGGESWRRLTYHVGAQDGTEIQKMSKKVWPQEAHGSTSIF